MNEKAINAIVIDFSGAGQKGLVYGRTKRSRWAGGKTKYVSVIREDDDHGTFWQSFERNTPEAATKALKEGLRVQMGLIEKKKAEPILVPTNDESPDVQMILKEARLSEKKQKRIHRSWSVGDQILTAIEELDLDIDPVADAIRRGKLKKALLGPSIDRWALEDIRRPEHKPEMPRRKQRFKAQNLVSMLVRKFGRNTPLLWLAEDEGRAALIEFYRDEIGTEGTLKYKASYRRSFRNYARRFFVFCQDVYDIRLPFTVLEERPQGHLPPVVVPKPEVIRKFVHKIITEHPELLLFVLLQLYKGLRPEEAFRALDNPMQYIIDNRFWYPPRNGPRGAKASTKLARDVRIRPLPWWLLSLVPGLLDGSIKNFHVRLRVPKTGKKQSVTGYYDIEQLQAQVNQVLREAGFEWEGNMPKEILRKIFLTAQYACKVPMDRIAQEASHAHVASLLDYIDQTWSEDDGLTFWSMVFSDDQPKPSRDLFIRYHAYGQYRPSPENQPHFRDKPPGDGLKKPRNNRPIKS